MYICVENNDMSYLGCILYIVRYYIERKKNPKGTLHLKGKKLDPIKLNLILYIH